MGRKKGEIEVGKNVKGKKKRRKSEAARCSSSKSPNENDKLKRTGATIWLRRLYEVKELHGDVVKQEMGKQVRKEKQNGTAKESETLCYSQLAVIEF